MENTIEILKYLFKKYPNPSELSKARVVKMIYLADWKSAIIQDKQLTNIKWIYNHYGPYVDDIINILKQDDDFEIKSDLNYYNKPREIIILKNKVNAKLDKSTTEILDFVIDKTSRLYWDDFIKLVYSTYPIIQEKKLNQLDLLKLAKEYKNVLQQGI
ncbi:Panacea domain-containing protein [Tenacibaculum finnmarkense]|uniref:Panacea domain-containing protein n=1 Tax=Tenacibaculum finnmarkense TaxID=2781243 RepID=UPI001EFA351C|nr:Panacea domain-containing protein [Tenacibaculum finnmarkense]MCG8734751.1 SocA family protein [Tenacibaculum finnmarkense]